MKRKSSIHGPDWNLDWALISLAALAFAARTLPGSRTIDDAYITFRYARNLVNGLGFVYNPGQHVQGTTTPLYTLLLAGLSLVFPGDYPILALVGHPAWSAFTCALALLTRPDALLVALPLFAHLLWVRRRVPWREGAILLLTLAPWVIFATLYFGSPLANSVVAKTYAYRLGPYTAFIRLLHHYATPFLGQESLGGRWPMIGLFLYPTLYLIGALVLVRRDGRAVPLVVFPGLYFVAFSLPNPLIFRWYLAPPLPAYLLCIVSGGWAVVRDLAAAVVRRRARWVSRSVVLVLLCAILFLELNAWTLRPDHGPQRPAPEMAWFKLEDLYRQVTEDLMRAKDISPDTLIAAGDIGVIGYVSNARILDTVGLISPESIPYYPLDPSAYVINYAIPTQLILDQQPDYVIVLEVYVRRTLLESPKFREQYQLLRQWDTDIYGSRALLVFRRADTASRP